MNLTQTGKRPRILFVEDNDELGDLVTDALSVQYDVVHLHDAEGVSEILKTQSIDILITDLSLPGRSGFDVLSDIRKTNARLKIIVTSGHVTSAAKRRAQDLSVHAYMEKPFPMGELMAEIKAAVGG